jgi:anti-sigma factor RsiW
MTSNHEPMTCEHLSAQLEAYLAGALPDEQAAAIEQHVSRCARCEAQLEAATRVDVTAFAPPLPDALRARTLAAIAAPRDMPTVAPSSMASRGNRWGRGLAVAATLASAAVLAVMLRREAPPAPVPPAIANAEEPSSAPLAGATTLAREQAASEFQSLDAATQELEAALKAAPDDRDVQSYLDAVRARRAELTEKVAEAAS